MVTRKNEYIREHVEITKCTVAGESYQPAIGDIYVLNISGKEDVKIQKSKCMNVERLAVGDEFMAVLVYSDNVLLSITNIEE